MARVSRKFIDDLISRVDITDFIGSFINLKKAGKNHSACCPFHNEKSPSFTVAQDKQFYHCFGCGEHGNVISFAMEYLKLEFVEAVEEIANFAGVQVEYEASSIKNEVDRENYKSLTEVMEKVSGLYFSLTKDQQAADYIDSRGINQASLNTFKIGYARNEWQFLNARELGVTDKILNSLSLKSEKNGNYYDFFRDRLIFPIRNVKGQVVAFGGRVLGDAKPKYLNSSESEIYKKREELYGLFEMRQSKQRFEEAYVVEGYLDVVCLHQYGFNNTVAGLGTALTEEQIQKLFKYVDHINLVFDGDVAGREAATKAIKNALPFLNDQKIMSVAFMPEGEDPDSLLRKVGADGFRIYINENSLSLSKFLFKIAYENAKGKEYSLEYKASVGSQMTEFVKLMPDSNFKVLLSKELADYLNVKEVVLRSSKNVSKFNNKKNFHITASRTACCALLRFPLIAFKMDLPESLFQQIDHPGMLAVKEVYTTIHNMGATAQAHTLMERLRDSPSYSSYKQLYACSIQVDDSNALMCLEQSIGAEIDKFLKSRLDELILKSRQVGLSQHEKLEMIELLNRDKK